MNELYVTALFDLSHTIASKLLSSVTYPWEALSKIISDNLNVAQTEELVGIYTHNYPKPEKQRGKSKAVIKDLRIFLNSINKAIDTMRLSGIDAQSVKTDTENFIEYTIRIPKSQVQRTDKTA